MKEVYFYTKGTPINYAKAYMSHDIVYFDIGQLPCGLLCGGQIIRSFPNDYARNHSFEEFQKDLGAFDIICSILEKKKAKVVLDEMWNYLYAAQFND